MSEPVFMDENMEVMEPVVKGHVPRGRVVFKGHEYFELDEFTTMSPAEIENYLEIRMQDRLTFERQQYPSNYLDFSEKKTYWRGSRCFSSSTIVAR